MLFAENDEGNIEYKRYLKTYQNDERFEELKTQLIWRVKEGNGEAIYYLGVNDDGSFCKLNQQEKIDTVKTMKNLVKEANLKIIKFQKIFVDDDYYLRVIIRENIKILEERRILLLGPSGVGKTTFLANIILGKIGNDARLHLFNHKHEMIEKKTSSFNYTYLIYNNIKWVFIEAPGDNKYVKIRNKIVLSFGSTINLALFIDYPDSNWNKKDIYIDYLNKMNIPFYNLNLYSNDNLFPNYNCRKPINKKNLFDNLLKTKINKSITHNVEFMILQSFIQLENNKIILTGILKTGKIFENQQLYLYNKNIIKEITINSIHLDDKPIDKISGPKTISICIDYCSDIKNYNGFLSNQLLNKNNLSIDDKNIKYIYKDNQIINPKDYTNYYQTNDKIYIIENN
jgi:GTPase